MSSASEASDRAAGLPPGAHLLAAADESQLLGMQLILNAHGIPHTVHRPVAETVNTWPRYVVVPVGECDRAAALVSELQVTPPPIAAWDRRSFRLFAATATLLMLGTVLLLLFRSAA